MFGIGETEFIIILVFAFLLFGPDKLPGMGRTLGRVLRQFREASEGFTEVVQTNIVDPATQELNNAGSSKRTPAAAQGVADDDDADIEDAGEGGDAPRKRETFAERKARLAAEKAAQEAAAAQASPSSEGGQPTPAADDDDADLPDTEKPAAAPVTAPAAKPAAEAKPQGATIEELYSRKPRSSRAKAEPAQEAEAADADARDGEEDGSEA